MLSMTSLEAPSSTSRDVPAWLWASGIPPAAPAAPSGGAGTSPALYWDMGLSLHERPIHSQSPSRSMMYRNDSGAEHGMFPPHSLIPPPVPAGTSAAGTGNTTGAGTAASATTPESTHAHLPPPHAMYPPSTAFHVPMHPEPAPGYSSVLSFGPGSTYPFFDAQGFPMLMHVPPGMAPSYPMAQQQEHIPSLIESSRADSFSDTWSTLSSVTSDAPSSMHPPAQSTTTSMDDLLALSRQAQNDGEGGQNPNIFVCPHCEKRYTGKHARSIWRRHLQDKHAIPLSVQPRRTRWDRDMNRPRNAAERRERMLESKRRWARKKREQERRVAAANRGASVATDTATPTPSDPDVDQFDALSKEMASTMHNVTKPSLPPSSSSMHMPIHLPPPAPPPASASASASSAAPAVTSSSSSAPNRTALAPRDINIPSSQNWRTDAGAGIVKSPGFLDSKLFMPSPLQSTPLRSALSNPPSLYGTMHSPSDSRTAPDSARRFLPFPHPPSSLTKRTPSERSKFAAFTRIEPSPRKLGLGGQASRADAPASPSVRSVRASRGDQFSSPQHLNLTQSLGLAPHSATKGGGTGFTPSFSSNVHMTPMGAGGGTPFSRMPLGLTPSIHGFLRGTGGGLGGLSASATGSGGGDMSGSGLLGGGDFSGYMMGLTTLDSPHILRSASRPSPLRTGVSFHSSSERDEDDDLDHEGEMRIISPSLRQRVRGNAKASPLGQDTPSKVGSPLRGPGSFSFGLRRTPHRAPKLR